MCLYSLESLDTVRSRSRNAISIRRPTPSTACSRPPNRGRAQKWAHSRAPGLLAPGRTRHYAKRSLGAGAAPARVTGRVRINGKLDFPNGYEVVASGHNSPLEIV